MNINLAFRYIKYYLKAGTKHDVHSPFVFSLVTKVIHPDTYPGNVDDIERLRKKLLNSKTVLMKEDFGAGHLGKISAKQQVSSITRHSSKNKRYCRLLYRIVNFYQPRLMIELGTAVGIGAMYLARGCPSGELITIEGNNELSGLAESNFAELGIRNVKQVTGKFDAVLPDVLRQITKVDFIYIDGNHRMEPTLDYFEKCLEKSHKNTIFVFDDINWNNDMRNAWEKIKNHHKVSITVDLFMMGLVFLNPDFSKQDFIIRY